MTEHEKNFVKMLKDELEKIRKQNELFPQKEKDLLAVIENYENSC